VLVLLAVPSVNQLTETDALLYSNRKQGGLGVGALLGFIGIKLAQVNQSFLIGQALDHTMVQDLCNILVTRPGIDQVKSVQSQWLSPYTFSFKAEVDFDGTYLASQLIDKYEPYFLKADMQKDLHVLLALYAEDVARATEREVLSAEAAVSTHLYTCIDKCMYYCILQLYY
jgi:solute carrier family 30 (zinc transporter), member 9